MMATNSYFNENSIEELLDEIKYVYQSDRRPWVIGYSGGKELSLGLLSQVAQYRGNNDGNK